MRRAALLALALLATPAAAQDARDALEAGDLICQFGKPYQRDYFADLSDEPPRSNLMIVYESVTTNSANVVSTGRVGKRRAQVRAIGETVAFIEPDGPSVRVTTLTECKDTRWKDGVETCVKFSARHAWHFDAIGALGADLARVQVPGASAGTCEAWNAE